MFTKFIRKVTKNIYYLPPDHKTDRPIIAMIQGNEGALIVDAGNSINHASEFLKKIKPYQKTPIKYGAITHWHWDHVFGIPAFDFPVISSMDTKKKVIEMATWKWSDEALDQRVEEGIEIPFCRDMIKLELPDRSDLVITPPQIGFNEKTDVDLGDLHCIIEKVGGDHAFDSSVVYTPEDKVLFLGDCLCMDIYHGNRSYSILGVQRLVARLKMYDANYYLDSHNGIIPKNKMIKYFDNILLIAELVDRYGNNIRQIKEKYKWKSHRRINNKYRNILQAFIVGLKY